MRNMKKQNPINNTINAVRIIICTATLLMCTGTFAEIVLPEHYTEKKVSAPNTRMFVNTESSAFIAVSILKNTTRADATETLRNILEDLDCTAEIKGNEKISSAADCTINEQQIDLGVITTDRRTVVFQTSKKVTDEEFRIFLENFIKTQKTKQPQRNIRE